MCWACFMPRVRIRDDAFRRRYLLRVLCKMPPLVVAFVCLWIDRGRLSGVDFWLGAGSFVVGIGVWAWDDRRLFRGYRCPRCGASIPERTIRHPGEGDAITYVCEACDVEWDTTLRA